MVIGRYYARQGTIFGRLISHVRRVGNFFYYLMAVNNTHGSNPSTFHIYPQTSFSMQTTRRVSVLPS